MNQTTTRSDRNQWLAAFLAVAVGVSPAVGGLPAECCRPPAESTPAHRDCCSTHDCGSTTGATERCTSIQDRCAPKCAGCSSSSPGEHRLAPPHAEPFALASAGHWVTADELVPPQATTAFDHRLPNPLGPPVRILFSVWRN